MADVPEATTNRLLARLPYKVPDAKRVRVILSTDAANEVDDQFAIAHALLTPQFIVRGIVAGHFKHGGPTATEQSYAEVVRVLELMGAGDEISVVRGAAGPMPSEAGPVPSAGSDLIVREALADDPHPLFVLCMGPVTDVASAYLQDPRIAGRLTVVWIGGGVYPHGTHESNQAGDVHAANVLYGSPLELWQVPQDVYSMVRVGTAELIARVRPCGPVGAYLVDNMLAFNERMRDHKGWPRGEDWTLGDSPTVTLVTNPYPHTDAFTMLPAPRVEPDGRYLPRENARTIRVYRTVNGRHVVEDLIAKLQLAYGRA